MGGRRGKAVFTTVNRMVISKGRTSRGNPEFYRFFLECGHVEDRHHSANTAVQAFMSIEGMTYKVRCHQCEDPRDYQRRWKDEEAKP